MIELLTTQRGDEMQNVQQTAKVRIGDAETTTHLYELGTQAGQIEVLANTRGQARKIAEKSGYTVYDVNMIG